MRTMKAVGLRTGEIGCFWCSDDSDLVGTWMDENYEQHEAELDTFPDDQEFLGATKRACRSVYDCAKRIAKES